MTSIPAIIGPVIVSGGASGLGRATAQALTKAGAMPIVFDCRSPDYTVEHEVVDVADSTAVEAAVSRRAARHRGIAGVFTAAGTDSCGPLDRVAADDWERVVRVNLFGTAAIVRSALPYLRELRGRIVTCASTLGMRVAGDASAYCASKFGVVGFTRALAEELKGQVGVTLLIPGGMRTAFFDDRDPQYRPGPDAKLNTPEDVAAAVLFAMGQPSGCEVREVVVTSSEEVSWP